MTTDDTNLKTWARLDKRTRQPLRGRGPDSDEAEPHRGGYRDLLGDGGGTYNFTAEGDFWKRSEYLKCKYGVPMWSDDRGLPSDYLDSRPKRLRGPRRTR